jgi:tRNA-2-methylthio-N6-dimethylallyladenosine synthase
VKFHIKTYGCQMNERDSEAARALLTQHGFQETRHESSADIVIVNTCSVRGKAEDKALGKLGLLVATKRDHPQRIVGAIGCVVQRLKDGIVQKIPGLDFAVGTHRLASLPDIVSRVLSDKHPIVNASEDPDHTVDLSMHCSEAISAFVNILQGCNRRCAYCVVPSVRGNEWSRPADKIVAEIRDLVRQRVKEVTLLGQSVMSYGRQNNAWPESCQSPRGFKEPFTRLLEAVNDIEGLARIRFTSGHPSGCTEELARAMSELPAVCEHLHLPLQSGSDRILKMMRRGYTTEEYRQAVGRIRSVVPNITVTTDIIVGFPAETLDDFDMTRRFMDEIGFDNAFVFKYSPRPDTKAAELKDDVCQSEKLKRNKILLADMDARGIRTNANIIGKRVEVLVEGKSLKNPARLAGRTRTNKMVVFPANNETKAGDIVNVEIERTTVQTLYGKMP